MLPLFENVCCQNLTKLTGLTFLLMCIADISVILCKTLMTALFSVGFSSTAVFIHEMTSRFLFVYWQAVGHSLNGLTVNLA